MNQVLFQIPGTGGSLVLKTLKTPEPAGITKKKSNTRPTLVFGSDTCNAVNGRLLSHQTQCDPAPTNKPTLVFRFETIHLDESQFLNPWTLGTLLELSAMGRLAGEKEPNEKKCPLHTPSIHGLAFVGAGSL